MNKIIIYIILVVFAFIMIVPFLWMTLTAFKTTAETMQVDPFVLFPKVWQVENFGKVVAAMDFVKLYTNTILMIALRVLCAVFTATLSGYAFARLNFKGKNFMFGIVLFQMMIPVQIFIIPQYVMVSKLHITNTALGLLFPGLVTAFGTFLLRQAYMGLPKDLEEAARLDGCNIPQTFLFVMAPLAKSSMVALGIFTAVFAYKDLMWPMIVLYIIFQKQFIEGIATSGGKL